MKDLVISYLKKTPYYKRLQFLYKGCKLYGKMLIKTTLMQFTDKKPKVRKPKILQLPITFKCNFNCIMCGMSKMNQKSDFTVEQLSEILKNPLFQEIESVGINGGEPFINKDLNNYVSTVISNLPKLKSVYLISNGYFTNNITKQLKIIKTLCLEKNIALVISFSLDGIGELHDNLRGKSGAFENLVYTCKEILKNREKYCDSLGLICTITKHNIYNINEVEIWAKNMRIPISYNIATVHKRVFNEELYNNFSIFSNEHTRYLTVEFFYSKFRETQSPTYFAQYYYALNKERISTCSFQYDGITLMPDSNIAYCATYSEIIGNALSQDANDLYFKGDIYRQKLVKDQCKTCSHYVGILTPKGSLAFNKELLRLYNNPFKYHP